MSLVATVFPARPEWIHGHRGPHDKHRSGKHERSYPRYGRRRHLEGALDVHRRASGDSAQFANDTAGFEALASWLGDTEAWVVYESTGPWHRAFEEALAGGCVWLA